MIVAIIFARVLVALLSCYLRVQEFNSTHSRIRSLIAKHIVQRLSSKRVRQIEIREGSATARLGVRDFEIHWISSGFRIPEWISGFQSGFLDFKVDFWISKWISGFQSGFLDFKVDFWISKWISGFQSGFLDFKVDFSRDFWISKRISGFHLNMAILSMI